MRRARWVRGAMALLAVSAAAGLGMSTGCAVQLESADYFTTPETVAAANAISRGNARGLERMIADGIDVNARGREGMDLLKWSLACFCLECFETLLEHGADIERPPAGEYTGKIEQLFLMPVMELAAQLNDPAYLAALLRHGGNPNALDIYASKTIIHEAVSGGRIENVRLLVEAGADIDARAESSLWTPLRAAVVVYEYDIAHYLLDQGADPTIESRAGYSVVDDVRESRERGVGSGDDRFLKLVERLSPALETEALATAQATIDRSDRMSPVPPLPAGVVEALTATYPAGRIFNDDLRSGGEGPEMVVIPAGRFRMGCVSGLKCRDDEKPVHEVTIPMPFAMSVNEVTFEDYDRFTYPNKVNDEGWGRGSRPVINVSWNDAKEYVAWLSGETGAEYRLPSEAEWEYAARAGSETKFSWGDEVGSNRANCLYVDVCGDPWVWTSPVGSFRPNAWGLHDMHGNVREWVEDCWNPSYLGAPSNGSAWRSGNCADRVLRGGALFNQPRILRAAKRFRLPTDLRGKSFGFRVVRTLTP